VHRFTEAEGAGESGLAQVIEVSAVNAAGDLMITLALANGLFFSVSPGAARSHVALYLLVTMVPFVVLAPVIGPLLDRLRRGRRYAMAVTMLARAILALALAKAMSGHGDNLAAYPVAFGCLAASKAYGVSRSAVMPRVLPKGGTLVRANARTSMAATVATLVVTPIGGGLTKLGAAWGLGFAALLFLTGTVLSIRLPSRVDSAEGEEKAQLTKRDKNMDPRLAETMPNLRLRSVGPAVLLALRANAIIRSFSGFLTIFLLFLLTVHPFPGMRPVVSIAIAAIAAAGGNALGTMLGSWIKSRAPEAIITTAITLLAASAVIAAFYYSMATVLAVAAMVSLASALSKLSLDGLLQREVLERVRVSAFARSETVLQLAYVLGGLLAIAMPTNGVLGLGITSALVSLGCLATVKSLADLRERQAARPLNAS
jgi:MFS family permease